MKQLSTGSFRIALVLVCALAPVPAIAQELTLPAQGVRAVVRLLAEGATVPFIARYRKEATGSLDEVQIRNIEERRGYLIELDDRHRVRPRLLAYGKNDDFFAVDRRH